MDNLKTITFFAAGPFSLMPSPYDKGMAAGVVARAAKDLIGRLGGLKALSEETFIMVGLGLDEQETLAVLRTIVDLHGVYEDDDLVGLRQVQEANFMTNWITDRWASWFAENSSINHLVYIADPITAAWMAREVCNRYDSQNIAFPTQIFRKGYPVGAYLFNFKETSLDILTG